MTRKRCRKLTKAEKEAVYAKPESNAGVGWGSDDDCETALTVGDSESNFIGGTARRKKAPPQP